MTLAILELLLFVILFLTTDRLTLGMTEKKVQMEMEMTLNTNL